MTQNKTHFDVKGNPACNTARLDDVPRSKDRRDVKCKNCKRTDVYRAKK